MNLLDVRFEAQDRREEKRELGEKKRERKSKACPEYGDPRKKYPLSIVIGIRGAEKEGESELPSSVFRLPTY
jgi:hypothetical protein